MKESKNSELKKDCHGRVVCVHDKIKILYSAIDHLVSEGDVYEVTLSSDKKMMVAPGTSLDELSSEIFEIIG